jgi:phenylalanyl-tRNA synthetase alpha chain
LYALANEPIENFYRLVLSDKANLKKLDSVYASCLLAMRRCYIEKSMSIDSILKDGLARVAQAADSAALEQVRVDWLGKKGLVTEQLKLLAGMDAQTKKVFGAEVNQVKESLHAALSAKKAALDAAALTAKLAQESIDVTLPGRHLGVGNLHPITRVLERMTAIFGSMGFEMATGPEIEDDFHNFEALNFPLHHPARTMHDTFYFDDGRLLRTHTSPVQIRAMRHLAASGGVPPVKVIAAGKVYRSDSDQTHSPMFHQLEGLYIAKEVSFSDLKGVLTHFVRAFFERDFEMRFRPSYFPFTEPSAEVDIAWERDGKTSWLEVLGCGMVHPNVLKACGIDPEQYSGFAFGLGVERFTMLRYGVNDLRAFFENDVRFLTQFA